ncbi:hypothetical protein [Nonomuraea sp. NPDC049141]|uniref:hypothetical protein n=1 Tax=Nonomuraea sp. NPDC049141 TaxID=3155500 RepID=UPI0033E06DF5
MTTHERLVLRRQHSLADREKERHQEHHRNRAMNVQIGQAQMADHGFAETRKESLGLFGRSRQGRRDPGQQSRNDHGGQPRHQPNAGRRIGPALMAARLRR